MSRLKLVVLASVLFVFGCASNPMKISNDVAVAAPKGNEAQIVFMRDSFVGSAINASLYELTDGDPVFIGIISNGTKIVHKVSPGKHTFMVVSEAADFMEAELLAGKTYYSLATPRMGAWKARFSLWPIKADPGSEYNTSSSDFTAWKNGTKVAVNSSEAQAWYAANKASIIAKKNDYWPVWQKKSDEDLAKRSLSPEDGM